MARGWLKGRVTVCAYAVARGKKCPIFSLVCALPHVVVISYIGLAAVRRNHASMSGTKDIETFWLQTKSVNCRDMSSLNATLPHYPIFQLAASGKQFVYP